MNSIENEKLQQMNTPNGGYRLKEAVKDMINYGSPILVQFPRVENTALQSVSGKRCTICCTCAT